MAVAQVQQRLKNLIAHVSVPALVINVKKGRILSTNPAAVRRYGYAVSSSSPIMLRGIEPGNDYEQVRLLTDDGEGFAVEALDDGEGEFELQCHSPTIGVLLEAGNQFEQQTSPFLPDTASYPSFHFCYLHKVLNDQRIYPDPALMKQLKLTRHTKDALKLKWRDLIVDEDKGVYDKAVATAIEHGSNQRLRYRIRTVEGGEHEIIDCFGVVREEGMWPVLTGTVISTGGSAHRMQQAERLSMVGRLVGSMIHDFRNLLGGMQNMLEWCMAQSPDDSPVHKAINKTIGYTDQANGLIRSTLRLLDGKGDGEKERIPVQELLNDVEGLIRHFGSAETRIRISCDRDLPPLYGQRNVLLDMMLNLGLNACDAMQEEGGVLQFEAVRKQIIDRSGKRRGFICLRVIDNGCGMSSDEAQSIFNEFYTTKEHGTGLGLWMVKEASHAMGGTVQVHSKPGEGSTFEVQIPVSKEAEARKTPKRPVKKASKFGAQELDFAKGKVILFIEDEPLLRDGVQTWLQSMGFFVHVASDGTTGKELFDLHMDEIDIVVQDYILPGIRGEVLLEHFSKTRPDIPVIVCSGYPDGRNHGWIIDKGAKAFLAKPFRIEKLVECLRTHLAQDSQPD